MSPIRRRMKKRNPSGGQNGQLVHWWLLIHSARKVTPGGQFHPIHEIPEREFLDGALVGAGSPKPSYNRVIHKVTLRFTPYLLCFRPLSPLSVVSAM